MENIYIFWHFTTHGIAYFKHILSAFYSGKCSITQKQIKAEDLSQEQMNEIFSMPKKNGFVFDKIYYFTASPEVFNKIVTYQLYRKDKFYEDDELLIEKGIAREWKEVIDKNLSIEDEFIYIKNHFSAKSDKMWSLIWRNIQHYSIEEQIWWFKTHSNARNIYKDKIEFVDMTKKYGIDDLRDYIAVAKGMQKELLNIFSKHPNANFIVNPSLGSNQIQVVWFSFASAGLLPTNMRFINTYDRKDKYPKKRFKLFDIFEIPVNIVSQIKNNIYFYDKVQSPTRKIAEAKMQAYINSGFTILLFGERGIGKTHLAERYKSENQAFISVNCASFTNNTIAESILFGYKKGAFTDAKEDRKGVFEQANNGILFLDEIHHLSKETQAKLMKAIETNQNNFFTIKRLGDDKEHPVKTTLIFATNRTIEQLREVLLPDFYDRITQLVIELPPLRKVKADLPHIFEAIWQQLRFNEFYNYKKYVKKDVIDWIKTLKLYGNHRDLQKIAIYYKTFLDFDNATKKMLKIKSATEFAKQQFERYISYLPDKNYFFDFDLHPNILVKKYKKNLSERLLEYFGSAEKIAKHYGNITSRTIYDWKKDK